MTCPKCEGKTTVFEVIFEPTSNERHRKRRCTECNHVFYTVEYEIELTDDLKRIYAENRRGRNGPRSIQNRCRRVYCIDTDTVYESISNAARAIGVTPCAITLCCNGTRRTCGGYRWEYYDEKQKE